MFTTLWIAVSFLMAIATRPVNELLSRHQLSRRAPNAEQWATLNATVEGRLAVGVPWSRPCFTIFNGNLVKADPSECAYVEANTFNSHLNRSNFFGTYMGTQWETCMATSEQCELDWQDPTNSLAFDPPQQCMQGAVPNYFINVTKKEDIMAAYTFSNETGIPLIVKNTGHDLPGRSSAPNSLGLWMHNMKYISHDAAFVPEGCAPDEATSAITYGAGQQFSEVFQFADDNGLVMVGGADESVGAAGGWAQGGGHSPLSPNFGLGVDRALEYKIVTPDGVYRVANACQNQDLFFALRGGGGGTFGVVLEASTMASPRVSMRVANINWNISDANYEAVLKVFLENATTFAEQGWGGFVTPSLGNLVLINSKVDITEAEASMQALLDVTADMGAVSTVTEVASYLEWFQDYVQGTAGAQDGVGVPLAISSRLIPQANHATPEARAQLLNVTLEANKYVFFSQIHFTTPYGFAGTGNGTSVTEAWRNALWQVLLVNTWAWNATLSEKQQGYALVGQAADLYRAITPGSGAYHNEADIHEPNHEISFWGTHYPELLKIKDKYDPDRILDCWHCVGWKGKSDPRFSCYI